MGFRAPSRRLGGPSVGFVRRWCVGRPRVSNRGLIADFASMVQLVQGRWAAIERLARELVEHRELDDRITEMRGGSAEDQIDIQRMKKRKLHLKDEISNLENALLPDIIA